MRETGLLPTQNYTELDRGCVVGYTEVIAGSFKGQPQDRYRSFYRPDDQERHQVSTRFPSTLTDPSKFQQDEPPETRLILIRDPTPQISELSGRVKVAQKHSQFACHPRYPANISLFFAFPQTVLADSGNTSEMKCPAARCTVCSIQLVKRIKLNKTSNLHDLTSRDAQPDPSAA
ncbi:hypothetical protein K438DRAFT_1777492 [Mycena galopus ATCC 62051]|nr:hypothetical protein K438DRAFT_1777492 [Mycena galopus ATCC 62051]